MTTPALKSGDTTSALTGGEPVRCDCGEALVWVARRGTFVCPAYSTVHWEHVEDFPAHILTDELPSEPRTVEQTCLSCRRTIAFRFDQADTICQCGQRVSNAYYVPRGDDRARPSICPHEDLEYIVGADEAICVKCGSTFSLDALNAMGRTDLPWF